MDNEKSEKDTVQGDVRDGNDGDITTKHKKIPQVPQDEIAGLGHIASSESRSWTKELSGRVTDLT